MTTLYQRKKLKWCKACKHHVSTHRYEPDPEGKTNNPPSKCSVPGCKCARFVRPEVQVRP